MRRLRVLIVAALVAVWMAPDARAMAVGIHLLLADHHHANHASTDDHHETNPAVASSHTHELDQAACASFARHGACTLAIPAACGRIASSPEPDRHPVTSNAPSPPIPLFLSHCSLLI